MSTPSESSLSRKVRYRRFWMGCTIGVCLIVYLLIPILPWIIFSEFQLHFWPMFWWAMGIAALAAGVLRKRLWQITSRNSAFIMSCATSILGVFAVYAWVNHVVRSWPVAPWAGGDMMSAQDSVTMDVLSIAVPVCLGTFNAALAAGLAICSGRFRPWIAAISFSVVSSGIIAAQLPGRIDTVDLETGAARGFGPFLSVSVAVGWLAGPVILVLLLRRYSKLAALLPERRPSRI